MKLFAKLSFLVIPFFAGLLFAPTIFADAKSDYEYQYSQYRQNYVEYSVLKKDYLENPTLDNQQKAVLAAKQTIKSRELAKASYSAYLLVLVNENKVEYTPIKPYLDSLNSAKQFYLNEAQKSQGIVTPADLKSFAANYSTNVIDHDRSFRTGVLAIKISQLVRFQLASKNAFDIILPKLTTPFSTSLQTRIDEIQVLGTRINTNIDDFVVWLFTDEVALNIDGQNYFTDKAEKIRSIQSLQVKWLDSLIDIDLNYAHS